MPENEPASRWHIEVYDPDIDDPPTPGEHDCIGEHDAAEVPVAVGGDVPIPDELAGVLAGDEDATGGTAGDTAAGDAAAGDAAADDTPDGGAAGGADEDGDDDGVGGDGA
ncbi:MAG TPA: hypothetical protein VIL36_08000 [Acidimicrobiales bacterium]